MPMFIPYAQRQCDTCGAWSGGPGMYPYGGSPVRWRCRGCPRVEEDR